MKRLILLIAVLFGLHSQVSALGFQSLSSGTTYNLLSIFFTDLNTGYASGALGTILKTTNAGVNWFPVTNNLTTEAFYSLYFINANTGYASGSNGLMAKTTNAGLNWTTGYISSNNLYSVYFSDQIGWTVGYNSCLKTTNSGLTWFTQSIPFSSANLSAVTFNNNKGFICVEGSASNLLTTTNSGANWLDSKIRAGTLGSSGICFNANFGVTVGKETVNGYFKPVIFMTTNNGNNWTESIINNRKGMLFSVDISPTNPNIIFAVGRYFNDSIHNNKGMILYSTNAGLTWLEEIWPVNNMDFTGVKITANSVFIVGDDGVILKSAVPIGIKTIGTAIPDIFSLSQNYPNPFNPTTNIEFSIPKNGLVRLSVFDITGKEVANLVNQVLSAGNYRVNFNASSLASGTYFYRLQSETYVNTKKMILIK